MDNNEEILRLLNRLLEELHQADGNNKKGSTVINIYGKGSQHVDKIEKQIIYTDAASKLVKDNIETPPPDLPAPLSTDEAMELWKKAQDAGYVDENYQPQISRTQAAILANTIARILGLKPKWKLFEILWNRRDMYHDYYQALNQKQSLAFQDKLKELLY